MNTFLWARFLYLRILAVGFAAGFLSLSTQIHGLIGPGGILPAREYLEAATALEPDWRRFLGIPSLLWLNSDSMALNILCWAGFAAAVLLFLNVWPRLMLVLCWLAYLSYVSVAQNFSGFQSDGLMLESALIAIFAAPCGVWPGLGEKSPPSRVVVWIFRWLLFRLMFESGMGKILSGDRDWRGLTAMDDYYENCPFPTWVGWYVQKFPHAFHAVTVLFTFFNELVCPILILCGRRLRLVVFFSWTALQIGIALTANYTYLNFNSIAIALFLVDDDMFVGASRRFALGRLTESPLPTALWRKIGAGVVFGLMIYVSGVLFLGSMGFPLLRLPRAVFLPVVLLDSFRSANRYGLFAVMTHHRDHVEFEGSDDGGKTWKTYEFKWQPQKLDQRPRFMAPHLPRFDWNLWFATLGDYREYPFVIVAGVRLIEGEPSVTALFKQNPFPTKPPERIRFPLYRFHFTDWATLRKTGDWWRREPIGFYAPTVVKDPASGKFKLIPQ